METDTTNVSQVSSVGSCMRVHCERHECGTDSRCRHVESIRLRSSVLNLLRSLLHLWNGPMVRACSDQCPPVACSLLRLLGSAGYSRSGHES
jgi:hypothetical protein